MTDLARSAKDDIEKLRRLVAARVHPEPYEVRPLLIAYDEVEAKCERYEKEIEIIRKIVKFSMLKNDMSGFGEILARIYRLNHPKALEVQS